MALKQFLEAIADAIRAKKGTQAPINAADFAAEIAAIEGIEQYVPAVLIVPPLWDTKLQTWFEITDYINESNSSVHINLGAVEGRIDCDAITFVVKDIDGDVVLQKSGTAAHINKLIIAPNELPIGMYEAEVF